MKNTFKKNTETKVALKGFLSEFRDALNEEINQIEKSGQSSTLLFGGRQIESHSSDHWYRFNVEYVPSLPADTPCKLIIGNDQFDVTVISFEANSIVISAKANLPDTIGKAKLENGATVLMERLIKCIEENAEKDNPAGKHMISSDGSIYTAKRIFDYGDLTLNNENTPSQNKAIISAISSDITYIWGPPGTGKTTVIGQIIDELYKHNRSVLIVSHTNTAVDGAIEKADKTYVKSNQDNDANYPILRIGTPVRPLPDRVLLEQHVAALEKELYEKKTTLETHQAELQQRVNEILPILAKDIWLKENKLDMIRKALQRITTYEKEIADIQCKIDTLNVSVEQERAAHPESEYANYRKISEALKSKRKDYYAVCNQFYTVNLAIHALPEQIQIAQDEVRKHVRYTELQAKEAKYMSSSFLKSEISRVDTLIAQYQSSISTLTSQQAAAQQTISDYEKKNSVGKLFAGKSNFTQAQATLERVLQELRIANDDLHRQQSLKQEYSQQLESLLLLQEQMRAVTPTKTPDYWKEEVSLLQSKLSDAQNTIADLSARKDALYEEISDLEQQQIQAKTSHVLLNELTKKVSLEQDKLAEIKKHHSEENTACSEQLKKEISLCNAFLYIPKAEDDSSLLDELTMLFESVKADMATVDVETIKKEIEIINQQLVDISQQLNELKDKMQELEKQAIINARIVGATLAKSYLSETLRERKFDTVILDEASMASIPALWCASYLAESSIVIVGDFLQLSPIVMARNDPIAKKWLGKDIFYHSGMQEKARNKATCPENFVMLNNQFRMESDIADIANMYYGAYGGLQSDDNNVLRVKDREEFYNWYAGKRTKQHVHLIDTESLHAWVTGVPQGKKHSRLNCFSAAISVDLAFKFLENKLKTLDPKTAQPEKEASVLIIAPYKPHIARINQLVELEYNNRGFTDNLNFIRAGTIHNFQGSEADIVIFDLVIDEPHWKANLFMTDKETNEDLRKMFNVAVTRAKFKLYIVGNFAYCQKHAKDNALSELLDKLIKKDKLGKLEAKKFLPDIVFTRQSDFAFDGNLKGKHIICREGSFNNYFLNDIKSFKKRLIVYSAFMTEDRLSKLLPAFRDAVSAGKQIIVVTKALSDRRKAELTHYEKCEEELCKIGVNILHKKGMHEKLIFVDSSAVWIGSLNALSFTGSTGEVMQRHEDPELTAEYEKVFDIDHICGVIENQYEQMCPVCGKEMLVRESDEGGIYWQCVKGDYSRKADQQYPLDGILRCKCGAPYKFAMIKEPRWVCSENSKHYQKMHESDLKLEKMASLLTKEERKKVDCYFENKRKEKQKAKKQSSDKEFLQLSLFDS